MERLPKKREPLWPRERDLDRYNELAGFEIQRFLAPGGIWIEIGIGKGAKPMRPLIGLKGVELKAIAPHARVLPAGISFTTGTVPEQLDFLNENRGRAKLVTDIFGAVSYYDDPVQALIYGAILLETDGVFIAFTELGRLGELETWARITEFFNNHLRQEIIFQTVYALGDASGRFSTYLRIRIEGKTKRRAALSSIFRDARRKIGVPERDRPLWASSDDSAKIWRTRYLASEK